MMEVIPVLVGCNKHTALCVYPLYENLEKNIGLEGPTPTGGLPGVARLGSVVDPKL